MAWSAAAKADLRNLRAAQELYYGEFSRYATDLEALDVAGAPWRYVASGHTDLRLSEATEQGWAASAVHPGLPGVRCVGHAGDVREPPRTNTGRSGEEGEVVCDPLP